MYVDYQISLDEDQVKRKNSGKTIQYINLELNFINNESESDNEEHDEKNMIESNIILKMYNHKIEKYQNSDKLLKNDYIKFLEDIKNGKKTELEEEYIVHKSHYMSFLKYYKNRFIYSIISPIYEFQTVIYIKYLKDDIIKVFEDFLESSNNFF